MKETIRKVIEHEAQAIKNIPVDDGFVKAIELIFQQVHNKKGKLVASGMGKAGQIAANIATTFSSTGTPSVFCIPAIRNMEIWGLCKRMMFCCLSRIQEKRGR